MSSYLKFGIVLFLLLTILQSSAFALMPAFTYHGRLLNAKGQPILTNTQFRVQITSPGAEACVLYEETMTQDLSLSDGAFSLILNDGMGTRTDTTGLSVDQIFSNLAPLASPLCAIGSAYTPGATDGRAIKAYINDGTGWDQAPVQYLTYVPKSIDSYQVGGFKSDSLVRVLNGVAPGPATPLTSANFTELMNLITGASTQYVKESANGAGSLPIIPGGPGAPSTGQIWYDSGAIKFYNGASIQTLGTSGGITALTGDVTAAGPGSAAGTVASVGASSAANIHAAELLSNAATNANTVSTIVKRDASGNFTAGMVTANVTGNITGNLTGSVTGASSLNVLKAGDTMTGALLLQGGAQNSTTSLASTPASKTDGTWFTGGTSTTTKPHVLIEPAAATSNGWSTNGTGFGINAITGFIGNLIDLAVNGVSKFKIDSSGNLGVGITPTADVTIKAGTAAAGTAPLKLTAGTSLTAVEAGAIEYDGTSLYYTDNFAVRHTLSSGGGSITGLSTGYVPYATAGSNLGNSSIYYSGSNVGIGTVTPTALLNLKAGTAAANTAPIKLTSGVNLTAPEAGAIEYDGTSLFFTDGTNARRTLATLSSSSQTFTNPITLSGTASLNGGATVAANQNISMASGTGTFTQTYSGTGTAHAITGSATSSGNLIDLTTTSTAAVNNDKALNIAISGANGTATVTRYGVYSNVTSTGATSTNVGGYFSASGASNNYGLLVPSGNVGVGTSTPTHKLEVAGAGWFTDRVYTTQIDTANLGYGISLSGDSNGPEAAAVVMQDRNAVSSANLLLLKDPAGNPIVNFKNSGNVGIGTSTPLTSLDVTGSGTFRSAVTPTYAGNADNLLTVRGTGSSASSWKGRITAGGDNFEFLMGEYNSHAWLGAHNSALNGWADLYINPEGSVGTKVFIGSKTSRENSILTVDNSSGNAYFNSGGNVGVGTATPTDRLSLSAPSTYGATYVSISDRTTATSGFFTGGGMKMYDYGGLAAAIEFEHNSYFGGTPRALKFSVNGSEGMRINSSGNVGIGTATPASKLDVVGTYRTVGVSSGASDPTSGIGLEAVYRTDLGYGQILAYDRSGGGFKPLQFSGSTLNLLTGGSSKFYIDGTGNVGVGIVAPFSKLDVYGNLTLGDGISNFNTYIRGVFGTSYAWNIDSLASGLQIKSAAGGATGVTIQALGNVGIGTAAPGAPLEINVSAAHNILFGRDLSYATVPAISLNGSLSDTANSGFFSDGNNNLYLNTPARIILRPGGDGINTKFIFGGNGSLGVNDGNFNSDPSGGKLSVVGNSDIVQTRIRGNGTQLSDILQVQKSDGSSYLNVAGTGNVGIGTTSPTSLLHTSETSAKTAAYTGVLHKNVANTSSTASINKVGVDIESTGTWNGTSAINTGLVVNATGGTTNYAATFSGGNVGIGTAVPGQALSVNGNIEIKGNSSTRYIITDETNTGTTQLTVQAGAGSSGFGGAINFYGQAHTSKPGSVKVGLGLGAGTLGTATEGRFTVNDQGLGGGTDIFTVLRSGNVGIGTTSPGYKLDVQGGDINASGSVRSATVALTSDIRFKKDIKNLDDSLDKILNLRGVSYNWRVDQFPERKFNNRHQIGVIAQEVEEKFPELVDTDKNGYKSVNYPAIVAPLIEALKSFYSEFKGAMSRMISLEINDASNRRLIASLSEKVKEIDELKSEKAKEIAELKDKNKTLEERLNRLEKALFFNSE